MEDNTVEQTTETNELQEVQEKVSVNTFTQEELTHLNSIQDKYLKSIASIDNDIYTKRLEVLAIDLIWKSSEIEGNTYSLLETEALIKQKELAEGKSKEDILKNIWPYEKKNLMSYSLNKLSSRKIESYLGILVRIDMQSKNVLEGNIWDSIYDLSISVAKNKLSVIKYN